MSNIFISDLHLEPSRPDIANIFFTLLSHYANPQNTLYILGDFFEAWIGDDDLTEFNLSVITALKLATSRGMAIFIMHGNRDFLLGKKFFSMTGTQYLADETVVIINGVATLLMHGDTLCTQDVAYLKFRRKTRLWLVKKLFLLKSLKKRRQLVETYRAASKVYTSTTPAHIMDVTQLEVERIMNKHQVLHLIHGHTHREAIHTFPLNGKNATRIVLAAWHTEGSALISNEQGSHIISLT